MNRLHRNQERYLGETIPIGDVQRATMESAARQGWSLEFLDASPSLPLAVLHRPPARPEQPAPRIYLSAGIHGDEPAGPKAVQRMIEDDVLARDAWLWVFPCLNPTGFPLNSREAATGLDLNRDYRHQRTPEVRAHVAWLSRQPPFDLTLCLHEDWEASGFYVYELNPDNRPSLAPAMLEAARRFCPIDLSPLIDGREARSGLIHPIIDPSLRPEWPEALYLLQHKTRLSYTLEAPSDFELGTRTDTLVAAVRAAMGEFMGQFTSSSHFVPGPPEGGTPNPAN